MTDNRGFWESWAKRYDRFMASDRKIYGKLAGRMKHTLNRTMTVLELALRNGAFVGTACRKCEAAGGNPDFSAEMIKQAKSKPRSSRLNFSVQDATNLPYAAETFDAVIISNALHIMPHPEKALSEIRRVLKREGLLIAPTFTAAGSFFGRLKVRLMELSGFRVFHKWTPENYLSFLRDNGFVVTDSYIYGGTLKLTYAEAKIME